MSAQALKLKRAYRILRRFLECERLRPVTTTHLTDEEQAALILILDFLDETLEMLNVREETL